MMYLVSHHTPGFVPEVRPHATESLDDAIQVFLADVSDALEFEGDDGLYLAAHTHLHALSPDEIRATVQEFGTYVFPYTVLDEVYMIETFH